MPRRTSCCCFLHPRTILLRPKLVFVDGIDRIEAGCDSFLMPSRYEPCGLNQIYSLKYGTVPVVHATGGREDTVEPWDAATQSGTGFKFRSYSAEAFLDAIEQALGVFADKEAWRTLMRNGMAQDFSWAKPAAMRISSSSSSEMR